ncbi:class I SAM-dependent methyltransferase [Phycicoccus sp. SLBN-51]|uniref:class I SAM-dependent methyltransferase n=1 Tax=Phycicoccus sp. SLBN-51 TaxID=2768447 RepID=UPI001152A02C|nr:class I SAM-dependent methyltransferase [Phycicoccus sp. SLBN-51]TQJ51729.1 methyltransferase family protein [Phycicoccus sp. SLBN-51]
MDETDGGRGEATSGADYAARLTRLESSAWKRLLNVQAPYRWNLKRLHLGRVLDVGCGIGRNLGHLDGNGVGVDHNPDSIAVARERGLTAYVPQDFLRSPDAREGSFDSMLVAHVLEHLHADAADELLRTYLPFVRPGGRVVLITPQEVGYRSDETHVRFVDARELQRQAHSLGLAVTRSYSFPFPRAAGKVFAYNEFVVVADRSPSG